MYIKILVQMGDNLLKVGGWSMIQGKSVDNHYQEVAEEVVMDTLRL